MRQYTEKCREISGFGGGYEQSCRNMVLAAMDWHDQNLNADLSYKEYKNVYGVTTGESDDMKKMQKEMLKACPDCSGAMMQAAMGHAMYAITNGWDKYIEEMEKLETEENKK